MDAIVQAAGYVARRTRMRGRIRLARLLAAHAPQHEIRYRDQWGFARIAAVRDELEAQGFVGAYELGQNVARHIGTGDWVIDVGANVGSLTAQFCSLVGPTGSVWAIEPVPGNVERLQQLKRLNDLDSLTVLPGALAQAAGVASIRLPKGGESGFASFTKSWDMAGTVEVTTWALDDLVYDEPREVPVAFLKLDVEGFEPQVLQGATRVLREMRPTVLCEFNDVLLRDAGSSAEDLLARFADLGYQPLEPLPELAGAVTDVLLGFRQD